MRRTLLSLAYAFLMLVGATAPPAARVLVCRLTGSVVPAAAEPGKAPDDCCDAGIPGRGGGPSFIDKASCCDLRDAQLRQQPPARLTGSGGGDYLFAAIPAGELAQPCPEGACSEEIAAAARPPRAPPLLLVRAPRGPPNHS